MDQVKIGRFIAGCRKKANLTQIQLADKLGITDKAVSKWERGESIPDVITLKALADLFSVSVDYFLRPDHPIETEVKREFTKRQQRNHRIITLMSCALVWLVTVFVHAVVRAAVPMESKLWMGYMYAVPVTLIVLLVLNSVWGKRRNNFIIISALVWSVLVCVYISVLVFQPINMWLLFVVGVPAQIIVWLWSGLRYK